MLLNTERAVAIMEKRGLDALIATSPQNVNYSSGIRHSNLTRAKMFVVLPRDDWSNSALLMPLGDIRDVVGTDYTWIKDLRPSGEFLIYKEESANMDSRERAIWEAVQRPKLDWLSNLSQVLKDRGLSRGRIGLDESGLDKKTYEEVQSRIQKELGARVECGFDVFKEIRMIKTEEEVEKLQTCARINEEAIEAALAMIQEGTSGDQIVRTYMQKAWEKGAFPRPDGIGLGRLAFLNNRQVPSHQRLARGDLVRFDVSCVFDSYYSDIARMGVVGAPTPDQKRYYEAVKAGVDAVIELTRPGARVSDLFEAAIRETRKAGLPGFERSHCGHGIGIDIYDEPSIHADCEIVLERNMVICVENPYYSIGFGAIHLEDTVLVTDSGRKMLTTSNRELRVVG